MSQLTQMISEARAQLEGTNVKIILNPGLPGQAVVDKFREHVRTHPVWSDWELGPLKTGDAGETSTLSVEDLKRHVKCFLRFAEMVPGHLKGFVTCRPAGKTNVPLSSFDPFDLARTLEDLFLLSE